MSLSAPRRRANSTREVKALTPLAVGKHRRSRDSYSYTSSEDEQPRTPPPPLTPPAPRTRKHHHLRQRSASAAASISDIGPGFYPVLCVPFTCSSPILAGSAPPPYSPTPPVLPPPPALAATPVPASGSAPRANRPHKSRSTPQLHQLGALSRTALPDSEVDSEECADESSDAGGLYTAREGLRARYGGSVGRNAGRAITTAPGRACAGETETEADEPVSLLPDLGLAWTHLSCGSYVTRLTLACAIHSPQTWRCAFLMGLIPIGHAIRTMIFL